MAEPARTDRPLVVGVGNDERSDDGAGLAVARSLARDPPPGTDVRDWPGELTGLFDLWAGRPLLIVVDAVRSGAPAGTVHRWELRGAGTFPLPRAISSHGVSLGSALELARAVGRWPGRVVVYGIEADEVGVGSVRTPAIRAAEGEVEGRIRDELIAFGPDVTTGGHADA